MTLALSYREIPFDLSPVDSTMKGNCVFRGGGGGGGEDEGKEQED
jgi:hypothetical protein